MGTTIEPEPGKPRDEDVNVALSLPYPGVRDRVPAVATAAAPAGTVTVLAGDTTDEAVLRQLYDEHVGPLLNYALRLTQGDHATAEDVVQEALLRAWRHPRALDPERGPVRPWLFTVVRNLVLDLRRRRSARPPEVGDEALDLLAAPEDTIDRALVSWEVSEALEGLSPEHRSVLVQTYYRGRSVAEAAEELGVPAGTVKSRTYYALRALRAALEERGLAP